MENLQVASTSNDNSTKTFDFGQFPVTLRENEILGRHLVAKRDIKLGEVTLKDRHILMAPNAGDTCLGCCLRLNAERQRLQCSSCGWPVCSKECENNPEHKENECEIFSKMGIRYQLPSPYCFIANAEYIKVVRCLLMSRGNNEDDKRRWELFKALDGHTLHRKSIPTLHFMSTLIKQFVQEYCKVDFDGDTIDYILGVIDVNAFRHTVHPNNPLRAAASVGNIGVDRNATYLYPYGAMTAHGCRRNIRWETAPGSGDLEMWAAEDIQEGQVLTHPYIDLMQGTPDRRTQLKNLFYFDCKCHRCSDPTELQTFFSTLKCPNCKTGDMLPVDPLDYETCWKCECCNTIKSHEYEKELTSKIKEEERVALECGEDSASDLASLRTLAMILGKYRGKLVHPNHCTIISVEYHLVKRMAKIKKPTVDFLQEMRRMIHKYLDIANVFYPGIK